MVALRSDSVESLVTETYRGHTKHPVRLWERDSVRTNKIGINAFSFSMNDDFMLPYNRERSFLQIYSYVCCLNYLINMGYCPSVS